MEMLNVINQTLEILNANSEWQKRYSGYLADIWTNANKADRRFAKPQGLSLYTTVGDRKTKNYYLRFKGQNVCKIIIPKSGDVALQCIVEESESHDIKGCPLRYNEIVEWHSVKASQFRSFFKHLSINTKLKSPEHDVENAILEEFRKRKGEYKVLCNIQPVLLHGCFFQMPTPLKASSHNPTYAEHYGGGIDMMARIKTSEQGHIRLCVIEIKDENKVSESQKIAMSQAVSYATFIVKLLSTQPDWMEFFMGHKTLRNRISRSLDTFDIDVVTIMPEGDTETFQNEILEIPGTQFNLHCHSLFYNQQKFLENRVLEFTGTLFKEIRI